jgi:hypothetical protein
MEKDKEVNLAEEGMTPTGKKKEPAVAYDKQLELLLQNLIKNEKLNFGKQNVNIQRKQIQQQMAHQQLYQQQN